MLRITKNPVQNRFSKLGIRFAAIALALCISAVIVAIFGYNPGVVFLKILEKALGTPARVGKVIVAAIPLIIVAVGVSIAFKMKFWNIGAEGQMFAGAICASFFALNYPDMSKPLLLLLMVAAGMLGGGLYALIAGFFRVQFNTNETLFTLMLNYIALTFVSYLQAGPWRDPNARGMFEIARFSSNARMPQLFGVHIGWIFALLLLTFLYFFFKYSKKGYETAVIGQSELTARYVGMNVKKIMLFAVFLSGAFCGLAGVIEASAVSFTLNPALTGGRGFTAIIIAWLSNLNAVSIGITSFFFSVLTEGSSALESSLQVPPTLSDMLQGIILFCVLGSEFFLQYKIRFIKKSKPAEKVQIPPAPAEEAPEEDLPEA